MTVHPKVRFAIVGAGVIGDVHARAVRSLPDSAELALIVDVVETKAATMTQRHQAEEYTTDVEGFLDKPDIDAVAVCTPSGAHAALAVAALEAGKHVLIEKPIDVSLEAADRIIAAERASGKKVAVISQHRFDRATARVAAAVEAGSLGTLTSANASCAWWRGQSYYDSGQWRGTWALDGGGATMNQAVHTIDLLISMLGQPTEVFAYTACLAHERIEVEDTAVAVVKFDSGALGTIHATTAAYPGLDASLRVMGSKGSAVISDDELTFIHENEGAAPEITVAAMRAGLNQVAQADRIAPEERRLGRAHTAQIANFIDAINTGAPIQVGTRQARTALSLILAMYESAETGRPVHL